MPYFKQMHNIDKKDEMDWVSVAIGRFSYVSPIPSPMLALFKNPNSLSAQMTEREPSFGMKG